MAKWFHHSLTKEEGNFTLMIQRKVSLTLIGVLKKNSGDSKRKLKPGSRSPKSTQCSSFQDLKVMSRWSHLLRSHLNNWSIQLKSNHSIWDKVGNLRTWLNLLPLFRSKRRDKKMLVGISKLRTMITLRLKHLIDQWKVWRKKLFFHLKVKRNSKMLLINHLIPIRVAP